MERNARVGWKPLPVPKTCTPDCPKGQSANIQKKLKQIKLNKTIIKRGQVHVIMLSMQAKQWLVDFCEERQIIYCI